MNRLGVLFVLCTLVACAREENQSFVRSERVYEHFVLGSNAPTSEDSRKIDEAVAALVDQETSTFSAADRSVIDDIVGSIQTGDAKQYDFLNYASRLTDPRAAAFWTQVLHVAAINSTFTSCAERELQLVTNMFVGSKAFDPGSDVRASCDYIVNKRTSEQPELWRVRNELLWACGNQADKRADQSVERIAQAQAYLNGKKLGKYWCR